MANKETVTIELAGTKYRMTSDAGEEHLQKLAALVNERIRDLGGRGKAAAPAQLLAVAALELADELLSEQDRRRELETRARATLQDAIRRIDERLTEDVSPPASP